MLGMGQLGLGQMDCSIDPTDPNCVDTSGGGTTDLSNLPLTGTLPTSLTPTYTATPTTTTPTAVSATSTSWTPAQLATLLGVAGTAAGNSIMALNAPTGYVYNPNTGTYTRAVSGVAGTPAIGGLSISSMIPALGIIVVAVLLITAVGGKK